jgi:hypothetical protein
MGLLTPEERARIIDLQDELIERFVAHKDAVADGQEAPRQGVAGGN